VALFFFNVRDGFDLLTDDEGVDLPDAAAAIAYATKVAQEIMSGDEVRKQAWVLEVLDETGAIVATVPFATVDTTPDLGLGLENLR
jgi:hypothetical protein